MLDCFFPESYKKKSKFRYSTVLISGCHEGGQNNRDTLKYDARTFIFNQLCKTQNNFQIPAFWRAR